MAPPHPQSECRTAHVSRALLNHFGGARAALAAPPSLARRGGAGAPQICSREDAEREIEACAKFGITLRSAKRTIRAGCR